MPAQCQWAGWVAWGLCFLSLLQVPGVALAMSLVRDKDACAQPPWQLSCQAGTGPQVQCWLGAEAALGHNAPTPFSMPMAIVPWLHGTRLCLGALWASWPVSGGLSSAIGLTLSARGVGDYLSSFISKPFPFVSAHYFLLSKSSAALSTPSSNGTPGMCLL